MKYLKVKELIQYLNTVEDDEKLISFKGNLIVEIKETESTVELSD